MKKLIFSFTNKDRFDLDLLPKVNRKNVTQRIRDFQVFCLTSLDDQKVYASGGTKFKIPTGRPCFIGLMDESGKITPLLDVSGNLARIKGNTILSKTGKGKEAKFTLNNDFSQFVWKYLGSMLGVPTILTSSHGATPELTPIETEKPVKQIAERSEVRELVNV